MAIAVLGKRLVSHGLKGREISRSSRESVKESVAFCKWALSSLFLYGIAQAPGHQWERDTSSCEKFPESGGCFDRARETYLHAEACLAKERPTLCSRPLWSRGVISKTSHSGRLLKGALQAWEDPALP